MARIEANMQTKEEAKQQMDEFKKTIGVITNAFNAKVDKYQEETDKKHTECSEAIKELKQQFELFKKGYGPGESGSKRSCNSATRANSADAYGQKNTALKDEIKEKLERRVTVGGFLGNSPKDVREAKVNEFLTSLGVIENYGKYVVFAKGVTGPEVVIQFESRPRASQFIKDNIEAIKKFKLVGKSGEERNSFFSLHMDEDQWKVYHASRLLTSTINDSQKFIPMPIKAFKHKGIVSINDFDIIKIKIGLDGNVEYKYVKQNIKDLGEEGLELEAKLKPIVDAFAVNFK